MSSAVLGSFNILILVSKNLAQQPHLTNIYQ